MKMPKNTENKEVVLAIIGVVGAVLTAIVVNWGQYFFKPSPAPHTDATPPALPAPSIARGNDGDGTVPSKEKEATNTGPSINVAKEKISVQKNSNTEKRETDKKQQQRPSPTTSPTLSTPVIKAEEIVHANLTTDTQCGPSTENSVAVNELKTLAAKGCHLAEFRLGIIYSHALSGVTLSKTEAFYWMKKAAEGDVAGAPHNLGFMYQTGFGVDKDLQMAWLWYQKAARQGRSESQEVLKAANKTW